MNKRLLVGSFLSLLVAFLTPAGATTVVPPADLGQLARMSETVTFAIAVESWVESGDTIPFTVTRFHLLQTVAGAGTGTVFEVAEPGGRLNDRAAVVAGAPRFEIGRNYLLFLDRAPGARWRSRTMAWGLLEEVAGTDLLRPLPEASNVEVRPRGKAEPPGVYRKEALLRHLREVARGASWNRRKVAAGSLLESSTAALHDSPASCVFLSDAGDGLPVRWFGFETGAKVVSVIATTPGQTGISDGGTGALQQAIAAWTNHSDSVVRYTYGGTRPRSVTCSENFVDYDAGALIFNDPCNDLADLSGTCSGTLAYGGALYDPTVIQTFDGEPWHPITSTFVVINNGAQCVGETSFKEIVAHEIGHTQGFGHHNPDNLYDATMSAFLKKDGRGAALAVVDQACASYAYPTYLDVPHDYWSWRWIEAIENAGVPTGCTAGNYCPDAVMTRDLMAVFLLRAKEGGGYVPPPCTAPLFSDVPCSNPFAPWINELVRRGVTAGCGSGRYCPSTQVTRSQMSVFLLATREGQGYAPAACTSPVFWDIPCSTPFAPWINELVRRGVTAGCGGGAFCPEDVVTRGQMAVFLATTFGLPLPPAP